MLPKPAITTNQIELMQIDTVASPMRPGLTELGVSPHAVEEILQQNGVQALILLRLPFADTFCVFCRRFTCNSNQCQQ
jgi:hypothetical protein